MGLRFIFMLTRNDQTVANAAEHLQTALDLGVRHIGFKDVGLPISELKKLNQTIQAAGATSYLEVVSLDAESEIASAKAAVDIGVNILLGGTRVQDVLPIVQGTPLQYCPFPGRIIGHPSILEGSVEEIVASARSLAAHEGVAGLDLLAYRSHENVPELMRAVCAAVDKPVYMAGSIATPDQISTVKLSGAAGFTIGTAALDGHYPAAGTDLNHQLTAVIRDLARLNHHLSDQHKKRLDSAFASLNQPGAEKLAAQLGTMQVKLAKFEGRIGWHFHMREDELFFVHKGRLQLKFRDREETLEAGEMIVVPHGVEHCPVVLESPCEVLLIEPENTVKTGNIANARETRELSQI